MKGAAGAGAVITIVGMFTWPLDMGTTLTLGVLTMFGAPAWGGVAAVVTPSRARC